MKQPRSKSKLVIAAIFTVYFLWCAYAPEEAYFTHLINLPIHEAGHVLFRILGEFAGIAGGSLLQILIPIVFFWLFCLLQKTVFGFDSFVLGRQ